MDTDRFDIQTKAASDVPLDQLQIMFRNMLAARFGLVLHHEQRERPVYTLVKARTDGRLGPRLHPAGVDCEALVAQNGGRLTPPNGQPVPAACGIRMGVGTATGTGALMSRLAANLSPLVGRLVIDRTGMTGSYDFDLRWAPTTAPTADIGANTAADGPSIFTALTEQLGLKLQAVRAPVDVLIVDKASKPDPD